MSDRKILGRAKININGQFYDSLPGATLEVGGVRNVSRSFTNSVKYNQTLMPGRVVCSVPFTEGMSLIALSSTTEAEVTFEADTGQTYIINNGVQVGAATVADGDSGGVVPLELVGDPAEEVMS